MRTAISTMMALSLSAAPASAHYGMKPCNEWGVGLEALVQPVSENQLALLEGRVIVYNIDTVEPAAASAGLAVVLPEADDPLGGSKCVAVTGFGSIDATKAERNYDPGRGLLLTIPTQKSNDDGNLAPDAPLRLRINLQKSTVELE